MLLSSLGTTRYGLEVSQELSELSIVFQWYSDVFEKNGGRFRAHRNTLCQ